MVGVDRKHTLLNQTSLPFRPPKEAHPVRIPRPPSRLVPAELPFGLSLPNARLATP